MISQENQTTYHFFHKLIVDAFFHKQPAGCDAVLSFVKEHWAHSLKQTHTHTVWIDFPLSLINQQNHEPKWFYHAHSLVHVAVTEDEERGLSSKFQGDFLHVANRTALADKKKKKWHSNGRFDQTALFSFSHLFMMCFPISVEPVKPSLRTSGWSDRRWPTRAPTRTADSGMTQDHRTQVTVEVKPTWSREDVNDSFGQPRPCC